MAPSDDAAVNGDGDELLEWLWDLPERYDVGIDDEPEGPSPVPAVAGVRKYLRKPGEAEPAAEETLAEPTPTPPPWRIPSASPFRIPSEPSTPTWGPSPNPTAYNDDRPTLAVDPVDPYGDGGGGPGLATILASDRRPSRFNYRDIASAVAVFLVVAIGVGVGYTVLRDTASHNNRVTIGSPSTTQATTDNGQGIVPPLIDGTSTTSTTEPATTTSLPAVGVGATTTTTRCATALAAFLPDDPTSVMQVGSTTTTPPPTTTTTPTTIPDTTTIPTSTTTSVPLTITLPTTATTTATTTPATVPRTTTTVKKNTTTTVCR